MGDKRNKIAKLSKTKRPAARKAVAAAAAKKSGVAASNDTTITAIETSNRRTTRSTKKPQVKETQSGNPGALVRDNSPLAPSVPGNVEEAAGDSQWTTQDKERLDNAKEARLTSPEQAASSENGTVAHEMPNVGKSQLAVGLDFILDRMEKEKLSDEEGLDHEANAEREEEYVDDSDEDGDEEEEEESEPAIVLEYQVAAADRLRNMSVSSAFTYKEHHRAIAGAMGFVDPKDVDALELVWKMSTAKKNELPAEYSGQKDLIKIINSYRVALEKEEKKKGDWAKKVKEGKTAGKKAPVPQDIVILVSNIGDGPKKGKGKKADDSKETSSAETKTDVTFYKSVRAEFPCAKDPMAVCFLDPFGNHHHVTPTDVNLWETLTKQNPEKYSMREIPDVIRASMNAGLIRRSAAAKQAPAPSGPSQSVPSSSAPNPHAQNATFPGSATPFPSHFGSADPSLMAMYHPPPFAFNPYIRPLGFDGGGFFGGPPSPARFDMAVEYPRVADWLQFAVDANPTRVSDDETYAHFGPILEKAGFRRINQLVSNKYVQITAETLKGLEIEVGFGSNILRWAAADCAKAERDHTHAHQKRMMPGPSYEGWSA
ncbi:hypothetical protein M407DRAFT_25103 [Tulasnella calospora MUT 4182]|uniref:Uncharacterized protein n=1 Tax=Tulasnella calospora MUT 4182 TaxID=1051891 RepID=A0A0C3KVT6_9AGAM|nr:hypothetical protein M407DRAFT_25103 [Tulasnella calospora MUT 4182]